MCGIAGLLHFDKERKANPSLIKKMTDKVSYRGPDDTGYHLKNNLALGHHRLATIDLKTGEQPMYSSDKDIVLILDGEIYNYIEIREELKKLGYCFKTLSDTEVVIKAYKKWGIDCQNKFNGMWSFALWDEKEQKLFLSLDRMGEKPLHYAIVDNTLIFGSEIKSIIAYGFPKEPNLELLEIYLTFSFIPAPYTFYKNIHKLKPGHFLTIQNKNVKEQQYWDLPSIDENDMVVKEKDVHENFENLFTDSIKIRMTSNVRCGAFLSGGLDSASIVAVMSENSTAPIDTFTMGFNEKSFDERYLASLVAKKFKTNHHENVLNPDSFNQSVDKIAFHFDEPFGDSSAIPTGYVSKFASSKVKTVLTGDGGDEVLSGYTIYQGEKFASQYNKLPKSLRMGIPSFLSSISKPIKGTLRYKFNRIQNVISVSNQDFQSRFLSKSACIDVHLIKELVQNKKTFPVEQFLNDFMKNCEYQDPFYKLMFLNFKLTLPGDTLVKIDRMSMAHSLETRMPFLDFRLIEYMVGVHKNIKMNNYERKSILRNTIGKRLPAILLSQPKKGFGIPLRKWFRENQFMESLNQLENTMPFLNKPTVQKIVSQNKNGEKDFGNFIWMLFILRYQNLLLK